MKHLAPAALYCMGGGLCHKAPSTPVAVDSKLQVGGGAGSSRSLEPGGRLGVCSSNTLFIFTMLTCSGNAYIIAILGGGGV